VITCTVTVAESCYTPTSVTVNFNIVSDECSDAILLATGVEKTGTTVGATPTPSLNPAPDVWYKFTPTVTGTLKVEVEGLSGYDTEFKIYSGACGSLTHPVYYVSQINNSVFFGSKDQTVFNVTSGTTYYIRVAHASGSNISGNFKITATEYSPPANNACSNATTLSDQVTTNGTTVGARDLGSLSIIQCGQQIFRNVWYKYTPTRNCALRVQVTPSSGSAVHISAFTNACSSPASINFLPANADCISSLSFYGTVGTFSNIDQSFVATAGTTYYFSVKSAYNNLFGFYDGTFDIKVTESNVATIQLKSGAPSTICSGGSTTLQVDIRNLTAVTDYTLVYSDGSSNFTVNNYMPLTNIVVSPTINRTYTLVSVTPTGGGTAISNLTGLVGITVNAPVTPSVSIAASPSNIICAGTNVTFMATPSNVGGGMVSYNFKIGGVSQQTGSSNSYASAALSNGNVLTCDITVSGGFCLSGTTATSNAITMTVNPLVNAGADITQTGLTFNLNGSPSVGIWSVVSPPLFSTTNIADVTLNNTTITNLPANTPVTLRWTVATGSCPGYDDVVLTRQALVLNVKALLAGSLDATTGKMNDALRTLSAFPTTSPYGGMETINPSVLNTSGDNAIVDWVQVQLRTSQMIVASKSALIQRDGDIVGLDGVKLLDFGFAEDEYLVAVVHRNHLGVMTGNSVPLSYSSNPLIDFTISTTATSQATVGSYKAMWAGDANGDKKVIYSGLNDDRAAILSAMGVSANSILFNVYDNADLDMNGTLKYFGTKSENYPIMITVMSNIGSRTTIVTQQF
jgi:hypothetical protein